jgi:hypothetical protein
MKKINTSNTNKPSAWTRLPGGKVLVLAACFGLGGVCQPAANAAAASYTGATNNWEKGFDYGSEWAGAYGSFNVKAMNRREIQRTFNVNEPGYSYASCRAQAGVKFLKENVEALNFCLTVNNDLASNRLGPTSWIIPPLPWVPNGPSISVPFPSNKFCLRTFTVGGYNVDSGTTYKSFSNRKSYSTTFYSASATYWLGYVPVTVSGKIGGGASVSYTLQLPENGAGVSGDGAVWISADASGGVGIAGYGVGPAVHMELGKISFKPSLNVTPTTVSGQANLVFDPVHFEFLLAVLLHGDPWKSVVLASYDAPKITWPLITPFSTTNKTCSLLATPTTGTIRTTTTQAKSPVR